MIIYNVHTKNFFQYQAYLTNTKKRKDKTLLIFLSGTCSTFNTGYRLSQHYISACTKLQFRDTFITLIPYKCHVWKRKRDIYKNKLSLI
jgi:hypothetical protein